MNFDKWASKTFLTIGETVDYLSAKSRESQDLATRNRVQAADVLRFAIDGYLPLAVDVPTGTKSKRYVTGGYRGGDLEGGLWDLLMEGERGTPGRQQIEHDYHHQAQLPSIDITGIDGAWVEREVRGRVIQRQLEPVKAFSGGYARQPSALSPGCVLGVRRKDLLDLAEKLNKELAEEKPISSPPKSAKDLDKPLGESERTTLLAIIAVLAKKAGMDIETHPTTAAKQLVRELQLLGATRSYQAIERKLKLVPEAIEKLKTSSK